LPAEIVPALPMPPMKVEPETKIAVCEALMTLRLSTAMPCVVPRITPLSTIAPVIVVPLIAMPILALIVPKFEILPPLKFATVTLPVPPSRMPAPFVAVI
jgi:hypothetical protein